MEVLGHRKIWQIGTLINICCVLFLLLHRHLIWLFLLRMLVALTLLIKHGLLNLEETTPLQHKLCLESRLRKVHTFCLEVVSLSRWTSSSSGPPTQLFTLSTKTSTSSCGCMLTSRMTILNCSIWQSHSLLLLHLLTPPTTQERWLISGLKSVVVTALGTTSTESASSGWLKTWTQWATISWRATGRGSVATAPFILLDCGWQTAWAWWATVTRRTCLWKRSILSTPSRRDLLFCYLSLNFQFHSFYYNFYN